MPSPEWFDIHSLLSFERGIGDAAEGVVRCICDNRRKNIDDLANLVVDTDPRLLNTARVTQALIDVVVRTINERHGENADAYKQQLLERIAAWGIKADFYEASDVRFLFPLRSRQSQHMSEIDYAKECLKAINCVTEFNFGEPLLQNIEPEISKETKNETDEILIRLWKSGYLQCDWEP